MAKRGPLFKTSHGSCFPCIKIKTCPLWVFAPNLHPWINGSSYMAEALKPSMNHDPLCDHWLAELISQAWLWTQTALPPWTQGLLRCQTEAQKYSNPSFLTHLLQHCGPAATENGAVGTWSSSFMWKIPLLPATYSNILKCQSFTSLFQYSVLCRLRHFHASQAHHGGKYSQEVVVSFKT